jgi:hypothetical protein
MSDSPRRKLLRLLSGVSADEVLVCPLVDGTYAAWVVGKQWVSEATVEDLLAVAEGGGYEPFIGVDVGPGDPEGILCESIRWEVKARQLDDQTIERQYCLPTPWGELCRVEREHKGMSSWLVRPPLERWAPEILEWYAQQIIAAPAERASQRVRDVVQKVGERGLVYAGVGLPFEMFGLYREEDLIYHCFDHKDEWKKISHVVAEANYHLISLYLQAGVDAIFFGPYGTELISPKLFEEEFLPFLSRYTRLVHELGGLAYVHSCSKQREWIVRGYYNQFEPDLLESLAPPPTGDIDDLSWARAALSPRICTKGNLDLGLLRTASPELVGQETRAILVATRGYRHIVGTADAVLPGTPIENIQAMVRAAKAWSDSM